MASPVWQTDDGGPDHGSAAGENGMQKHITVLGALYVGWSILHIIGAIVVFLILAGGSALSRNPHAFVLGTTLGTIIATVLLLKGIPELIGGIGLLKNRSWSRILILILGCINLLHIPLGTALGVYTLWVLTKNESVTLLSGVPR
jgi:hypothetical protein